MIITAEKDREVMEQLLDELGLDELDQGKLLDGGPNTPETVIAPTLLRALSEAATARLNHEEARDALDRMKGTPDELGSKQWGMAWINLDRAQGAFDALKPVLSAAVEAWKSENRFHEFAGE